MTIHAPSAAASRSSWRSVVAAVLLAVLSPVLATAQEKPSGTAAAGRIEGAVTDVKGKALAGTTVTLTGSTPAMQRTATTDKKGNYRFEDVPAGEYTVSAELPDFVAAERIAVVGDKKLKAEVRFFLSAISTVAPKVEGAPRPVITPIGR
jgi:hypothetical protein